MVGLNISLRFIFKPSYSPHCINSNVAGNALTKMREQIEKVFKDNEETPLFYIESGSRLWGIASPDSDFDVRGFHLQSKRQYFDFKKHRDIIEIMDGDFDFVSYDLDKMFGSMLRRRKRALSGRRFTGRQLPSRQQGLE